MRQTLLLLFLTITFSAHPSAILQGQPSGGPYGPVPQVYSIPDAKTVYYAAPAGDPASDGLSIDSPTTIESAIVRALTGDAIVLRGGIYRTGGLRFNQGIVIQPYMDELPVFKGTRVATDWTASSDGRWSTSWDRLFPAAPADWWRAEYHVNDTPLHRFNYDMVFADDKRLVSAGSVDAVDAGSYFIDYANGLVTIGVDPASHVIEITAFDSALVRTMRAINGLENDSKGPTIRGIKFTRYARLALLVEGIEPWRPMDPAEYGKDVVGTTLEHLTLSHCSRVAGYFRGDRLIIRNCLVSDCGTEGLYVINSAHVLLERNMVTRTNSHAPIVGYYASSVKIFNQSHYVVCRDNLIIDNPHASGIWYDVGNNHGQVLSNWIETTNDGFFFEISEGAVCAGNVFVDCTPGVRILNSADVGVYQNTFFNSSIEVIRDLRSSEAGDHFGWHASSGPSVADRDRHVITNNLLLSMKPIPAGLIQYREGAGVEKVAKNAQVQTLDGNVYVRRALGTPLFSNGGAGYPPPPVHTILSDFAELQMAGEGYEANGIDYSDFAGPVVVSPQLKRFELLSVFPGSQTGVALPPFVLEMLGWKTDAGPFPGAWAPVAH